MQVRLNGLNTLRQRIYSLASENEIALGEYTFDRWLQTYKTNGLPLLLEEPLKTGRPKILDIEEVAKIQHSYYYLNRI